MTRRDWLAAILQTKLAIQFFHMSCGCQPSSSNCTPFNPCAPENYGGMFPSLVGPMGPPGGQGTFLENYGLLRAIDATVFQNGYLAYVAGYAVAGDGGEGIFQYLPASVAADNDGTIISPANAIGRWHRVFSGSVNVRWFGANNNGIVDATTKVQNAINFCKTSSNRILFFPVGTYLVTQSLNCTFDADGEAAFWIVGEDWRKSIINGILTEAYPVLDFSGDTRGGIRNIEVVAPTGLATCTVFSAKPTAAANYGNVFTVDHCAIGLKTGVTGTINDVALVIYNTDLSSVFNSEINGPTACTAGFGKRAAITSKYQTTPALQDSTLIKVQNCIFNSWAGPSFEYTGGAKLVLDFCYLALVGAGYTSNFKISGTGGKSVYARSLEMENQSVHANVDAIYFETPSLCGEISGDIEAGSAGGDRMFNAPVSLGSSMAQYKLIVASSVNPIFRSGTVVKNVQVFTQQNTFGGPLDATSYGLDIAESADNWGRAAKTRWAARIERPFDDNVIMSDGSASADPLLLEPDVQVWPTFRDARLRVARSSAEWLQIVGCAAGHVGGGANNIMAIDTVGNPNARRIIIRKSVDAGATYTQLGAISLLGDMELSGTVQPNGYTVANLPSGLTQSYAIAFVSDATTAQGVGSGLAPVGGGANKRPVFTTNNGTNWLQF